MYVFAIALPLGLSNMLPCLTARLVGNVMLHAVIYYPYSDNGPNWLSAVAVGADSCSQIYSQ